MEPFHFDDLTKSLATSKSRRQALKALAATVGGAIGLSGIENVFAKGRTCIPNGKRCSSKLKCCSGYCDSTTGMCAPLPANLGCTAGSQCESVCPATSNSNCNCGTTMAGAPVCYLSQNGCNGPYCSTDADCGAGNACVNLNGGCGGCDNLSGGKGVCNPICTS